jgi:hypothetical protein
MREQTNEKVNTVRIQLNPDLVAFNARNRERNAAQSVKIAELMQDETVADFVVKRVNSDILRLSALTTDHDRLTALKTQDSFGTIVLSLEPLWSKFVSQRAGSNKLVASQSERAKKQRILLGADRLPLKQHIRRLISKPERRYESPQELWPHLLALFDVLEIEPQAFDTNKNPEKWFIEYQYGTPDALASANEEPPKRRMTYRNFRRIVSDLRRAAASPAND